MISPIIPRLCFVNASLNYVLIVRIYGLKKHTYLKITNFNVNVNYRCMLDLC